MRTILCFLVAAILSSSPSPGETYTDDRIQVAVPSGWQAAPVIETVGAYQVRQIRLGGVLIKGKFRIYLLTHYAQASGVASGRFGDISKYLAPWKHREWRSYTELGKFITPVNHDVSRVDLFTNPASGRIWSGTLFKKVCFGCGGFFLSDGMVFTATWSIPDAKMLPRLDDPELARFLHQASGVVGSIHYLSQSVR